MRPIDANKLEGKVREYFKEKITRGVYAVDTVNCSVDICRMVEEQPTACDVEKVVALLEEELKLADDEKARCIKENPMQFDSAKGYAHGIAVAIEIVKRGGRNGEK